MPMRFGAHAEQAPRHMLTGVRFPTLVRLNERTPDGRLIRNPGFSVRDLPLSFSAMFATSHGEPGQAVIVGSLDEATVEDDGTVWGLGWLMDSPEGHRAGRLMQAGALRFNSVELAVEDYDVEIDWERMDISIDFIKSKLSATTLVANPAMEGCTVELEDPEFDFGAAAEDEGALVASLSSFTADRVPAFSFSTVSPVRPTGAIDVESDQPVYEPVEPAPPASWFTEDDRFAEFSPIRIEEPDANGFREVWGFLFDWETPHVGLAEAGVTMRAPHSRTDYAYFANGETLTDDGTFVATGRLVLGCAHADEAMGWRDAANWYGDKGRAWAAVAIGENRLGGWVHGYVLPGTPAEDIALARALGTSGDWRRIGGSLELIAGLSVNAEGFPKPRPKAYCSHGQQFSLIGAGYVPAAWAQQRATGQFLPKEMYEDMATVAAFAQRTELEDIAATFRREQADELRDIAEALR